MRIPVSQAHRCLSTTAFRSTIIASSSSPQHGRSSRFKDVNDGGGGGEGEHKLTLEHFVLRSKSIKLYRDFLRASRNIPNPAARRETVDWLRDEHFEGATGLKSEFNITRVRELLIAGNVALKRICGPMELVAALNPRHGSFPKLRGSRSI